MRMRDPIKLKSCKWCGDDFTPRSTTQVVCKVKCAVSLEAHKKKAKEERQRTKDLEFQEMRERVWTNDKPKQLGLTQKSFNSLILLLDARHLCISCDLAKPDDAYHCGHFLTVGSHPELRFDPRNAFKQCASCNLGSSRPGSDQSVTVRRQYEKGILERKGAAHLNWLLSYHPPKQYTGPDLIDLRGEFNKEKSLIKAGNPPSRDWRALP